MMKERLAMGLTLGVLWTVVSACSVTSSPPPYPDVQTFCNAKAKGECQIAALCGVDPSSCQTYRASRCMSEGSAATGSGPRRYVADNAPPCIDAVNGAYGNGHSQISFAQLEGSGSIGDKCERVFSGNTDKGSSCQSDYDCASGRVCAAIAPGSMQRVCADSVHKNSGDFCSDPGSTCATDTYCTMQDGGAAECLPSAQAGQACGATTPCVSADRCVTGYCVVRAEENKACSTSDDCASAAPYCDGYAGNICRKGLSFGIGSMDCQGYQEASADGGAASGSAGDAAEGGPSFDAGGSNDAANASAQ